MGLIPPSRPTKIEKKRFSHTKNDHEIEKYQKFEYYKFKKVFKFLNPFEWDRKG